MYMYRGRERKQKMLNKGISLQAPRSASLDLYSPNFAAGRGQTRVWLRQVKTTESISEI